MNFRTKNRKPLELSLTPMIDVVFLLLIFFMVTTTFSKESMIKIQLPQADGVERSQEKQLILTIDQAGLYFLDGKAVGDKSTEKLTIALDGVINKQRPLLINADARAPIQSAISVLDIASKKGFKNITFATQKD
ncbi:MAG: biopolymer transporter ExbD [Methyloprofundus sp.]|nr:biopolymer transporter ExbD [Methyloprofundus sp.]